MENNYLEHVKKLYSLKDYDSCLKLLYKNDKSTKLLIWSLIILSYLIGGFSIYLSWYIYNNTTNATAGVAAGVVVGVLGVVGVVVGVLGVVGVVEVEVGSDYIVKKLCEWGLRR